MKTLRQAIVDFQQKYYARRPFLNDFFADALKRGYYTFGQKGRQMMASIEETLRNLEASPIQEGTHDRLALKEAKRLLYQARKSFYHLNEMVKPLWRQWLEAITVALLLAFVLRNFVFGLYHVPTGSAEPNILVGDRVWGNKAAYFISPVRHGDLVIFDNPEFRYDTSSSIGYYWQKYVGFELPLLGLRSGPDNLVKRVIGLPGDVLQGKIEDSKTVVYRNGVKLEEPYVNKLPLIRVRKQVGFIPFKAFGPFSIPGFLQKRYSEPGSGYTYDPSRPLDEQPYYNLEESELVRRPGSREKLLSHAYDPIYYNDYFTGRRVSVDEFGPFTVPEGHYWVMGDSRKNSRDSRYFNLLNHELIHGRASFIIFSIDSEEPFWLFELLKSPIKFWTKKIRYNRFFKSLWDYNNYQESNITPQELLTKKEL